MIEQWGSVATSSTLHAYYSVNRMTGGPGDATGPPHWVFSCRNSLHSWIPGGKAGSTEWLAMYFPVPVMASAWHIYQTFDTGGISAVHWIQYPNNKTHLAWSGTEAVPCPGFLTKDSGSKPTSFAVWGVNITVQMHKPDKKCPTRRTQINAVALDGRVAF